MSAKANKTQYRIRNWSEYDAALKKRGSLTFWVDDEVLAGWLNEQKTGKRGASPLTRVDFLHLSLKSRQGRQGDKEDKGEKLITSFK